MRIILIPAMYLLMITLAAAQPGNPAKAKEWLQRSMQAMGSDAWKNIQSFGYSGLGYSLAVEQSERSEGPYLPMPLNRTVLKDLVKKQAHFFENAAFYNTGNRTTYVIDGPYIAFKARDGQLFPWMLENMTADELTLAPEFILQDALQAGDLYYQKDTLLQQVSNVILVFKLNKYPVRLFISKETDFLTAVEITKPYSSGYLNIWGDTKKTILYSFWNLLQKDLHYPLQSDTYVNGWYYTSFLINKWKINAAVGGDSLRIPDSLRTVIPLQGKQILGDYAKGLDDDSKELAPGVWYLPGPCNATVVDQPDGLVVIDAGFSSEYGELLLKKISSLYPGKKIKAIVSTSDAWLHIGGLRPFAAQPGITIYHHQRNASILNKLLTASYITSPDALAKVKKSSYQMKAVDDSVALGTGANKIVLYTFKTESGERMMMVWFPGHQLVYASDLFQPKGADGQYWLPHYSWEVYTAIKKRKIAVTNFYGMHTGLVSFAELEKDYK
ncbi:MAG: MBL fold metallo-hydrolase [Bacteroidota bacterium]